MVHIFSPQHNALPPHRPLAGIRCVPYSQRISLVPRTSHHIPVHKHMAIKDFHFSIYSPKSRDSEYILAPGQVPLFRGSLLTASLCCLVMTFITHSLSRYSVPIDASEHMCPSDIYFIAIYKPPISHIPYHAHAYHPQCALHMSQKVYCVK